VGKGYGKISNTLWSSSRKWRALKGKDRPRLLYFFFHTCPQRNSIGCYPCSPGYIAADMGWGENQVMEAIEKLKEVHLIDWNTDEEIVRIIDFLEKDPPTNLKHAESMAATAMTLPDCAEKARALGDLLQSGHAAAIQGLSEEHDRLSKAYPYPIDTPLPLPRPLPRPKSSLRSDSARARVKLPEGWPSQHDRDLALAYWRQAGREDLAPRLDHEVTKARAHHLGKGTRAADWGQVWVTWYTRALEYNRAPYVSSQQAKILKVVP